MNADLIDFAKARKIIEDKNERAGRAVWEYGLAMLKNGVKPKELSK